MKSNLELLREELKNVKDVDLMDIFDDNVDDLCCIDEDDNVSEIKVEFSENNVITKLIEEIKRFKNFYRNKATIVINFEEFDKFSNKEEFLNLEIYYVDERY